MIENLRNIQLLGGGFVLSLLMMACPTPAPPSPPPPVVDLGSLAKGSLTALPDHAVANLEFQIPEGSEALLLYVNPTNSPIATPGSTSGIGRRSLGQEGAQPSLMDKIRDSNREIVAGLTPAVPGRSLVKRSRALGEVTVGTSQFSYKSFDGTVVPMVLRRLQSNVEVGGDEKRNLYIWVAEDCWGPDSKKAYKVDGAMVEALGDRFLSAGADNDIYDWTTGLVGSEYGPNHEKFDDLIPFDQNIHIFVYDLEGDNSTNGGIMGYFWSGNNVMGKHLDKSNEVVAFTVDAVALANPVSAEGDTTWTVDDYWPREIFSTLAHELQHTISFYQKSISTFNPEAGMTSPVFPEVWLEEMNSMVVEDYLAYKMGVAGPRGVDSQDFTAGGPENQQGRIPLYNLYSYASLTTWREGDEVLLSYSQSYAFGAYLARTYGPGLARALVQSTDTGLPDLTSRLAGSFSREGLTVSGLLAEWQAAVQLSSWTEAPDPLKLNKGGVFGFTLDGKDYKLGSLNHHNYSYFLSPGPRVWRDVDWSLLDHFEPASVTVFKASALDGKVEKKVSIPSGMTLWVLVK